MYPPGDKPSFNKNGLFIELTKKFAYSLNTALTEKWNDIIFS